MVALFRSLTLVHILIAIAGLALLCQPSEYQANQHITCGLPVVYAPPVPQLGGRPPSEPTQYPSVIVDMPVQFAPRPER